LVMWLDQHIELVVRYLETSKRGMQLRMTSDVWERTFSSRRWILINIAERFRSWKQRNHKRSKNFDIENKGITKYLRIARLKTKESSKS
jgi:hypothetical protein